MAMIPVQGLKSNTVWSIFLFLFIILQCSPYCKCTSQYWLPKRMILRFYINICKWRTYKLIYDHGEDWKLFIAIELVQTIFLGIVSKLNIKIVSKIRKCNASSGSSFRPNSARGSIETLTIGKTHLNLY